MKYTKFPEADGIIRRYLEIIVKKIRQRIPKLRTIILSGGYGRGEGAVEFTNKKPRILNDFDIYVITEKQIPDKVLEKLGKECSILIGKGGLEYPENYKMKFDFNTFFNVDIRCLVYKRLRYLPPTIRYFEMKNATTILYGENIFPLIPEIKPNNLPVSEGIRILSNRMMSMFLSMKEDYLKKEPTKDEIGIVNYYIAKAYIACCEALLTFSGDFRATYEERNEIFKKIYRRKFPELYRVLPGLEKKVDFATRYKMNPDIKKMDYEREWFNARKCITEVFRYIILSVTKKEKASWEELSKIIDKELPKYYFKDYADFMMKSFKVNFRVLGFLLPRAIEFALSFLYFLRLKEEIGWFYLKAFSLRDPGLKILSVTHLILLSLDEKGKFNPCYCRQVIESLNRVYPVRKAKTWKELKESYLDAYKLYYLRRFV